jgi:hypothetical protein
MSIPLRAPFDSGATPSARHCRSWSLDSACALGNDAQATVLHSRAKAPALFQPGLQPAKSDRRSGCAGMRDVNTEEVMANQG